MLIEVDGERGRVARICICFLCSVERERAREREYGLKESLKNERVNGRVAGESEFD